MNLIERVSLKNPWNAFFKLSFYDRKRPRKPSELRRSQRERVKKNKKRVKEEERQSKKNARRTKVRSKKKVGYEVESICTGRISRYRVAVRYSFNPIGSYFTRRRLIFHSRM